MPARADDLATLCRSCGLCCDGSLFGRVPLEPDEVAVATRHRLRVVGARLEQPCAALRGGACTIYDERPRACARFTCRLYERHKHRGGPLAPRLDAVKRVRALLDGVANGSIPREDPRVEDLARWIEDDFSRG